MLLLLALLRRASWRNTIRGELQNRGGRVFLSDMSKSTTVGKRNRLAQAQSPYLRQHANNPVDWFPWGEEAFCRAREEKKLIFLSVGYSTCHWCHVMEEESFENTEVAEILNRRYVSIKVDREERPDVDRMYMPFVQMLHGGGGWPMTVWLTPTLDPVFGGTYYPPYDVSMMTGLITLLRIIADKWDEDSNVFLTKAASNLDLIRENSVMHRTLGDRGLTDSHNLLFKSLSKMYDQQNGGFGRAPKFPQPVFIRFLTAYMKMSYPDQSSGALDMMTGTLRALSRGGIYDHIGQGFHRYSVDRKWHVPHFEKMLYDQAQLLTIYLECYQVTHDEHLLVTARGILEYVLRNLQHKSGCFYSAEDADSLPSHSAQKKVEGAFYVWEKAELVECVRQVPSLFPNQPDLSDIVCSAYGVEEKGNVPSELDPRGELLNKNVLILTSEAETLSRQFNLSVEQVHQCLNAARIHLASERSKRPRPHLDDKILTSWNGLMLSALSLAYRVMRDPSILNCAVNCARSLLGNLLNSESGQLWRCCYTDPKTRELTLGAAPVLGFSVDYAFLIQALIDLYESTLDTQWLEKAMELQQTQLNFFWDEQDGGFFETTTLDQSIKLQSKEEHDGAEPCCNSVSASNLVRLSRYLVDDKFLDLAKKIVSTFGSVLQDTPTSMAEMVRASLFLEHAHTKLVLVGSRYEPEMEKLIDAAQSVFLPNLVMLLKSPLDDPVISRHADAATMTMSQGRPTAYICRNNTCLAPVTTAEDLLLLLQ